MSSLAYQEIPAQLPLAIPESSGLGILGSLPRFPSRDSSAPVTAAGVFRRWRGGTPAYIPVGACALVLLLLGMLMVPYGQMATAAENRWASLRNGIEQRAAIEFAEDFHSGLGAWVGGRGWDRAWPVNPAGYVRPGRLALYAPSLPLTDYRLEFLGQVERKGITWVYRAADLSNFSVAKVVVTKPGPRPIFSLVRYQVVKGRNGPVSTRPIRLMLHNDVPYRIAFSAIGAQFSVTIEGTHIDSWTEDQRSIGGVGFSVDKGERWRVYWMRLSYQDDTTGKLCRRIVPLLPVGLLTRAAR